MVGAWMVGMALATAGEAAAGTGAATAAGAGAIPVAIGESLVKYTVAGDTASELLAQMRELGPVDGHDGKRYQGNTRWSVRWTFMMAGQPAGPCRLAEIAVNLDVTMTLPDWQPGRHADARLKSRWPVFLDGLTRHEMGHRNNGVLAAFAVRDALAGVAPAASCAQLADAANGAAKAALAARENADADYDRETGHGARQGFGLR